MQAAEQLGPEVRSPRVADAHPEHFSVTGRGDAGGGPDGSGDNSTALADVEVGRVQQQVGEPGVVQPAMEELSDDLVDLPADSRDLGLADPGPVTQRRHEVLELPGEDPIDPGRADHRPEGLADPARMEQSGIERAGTQLRDRQIELSSRGGQALGTGAVTTGRESLGAFVASSADLRRGFGIDEVLKAGSEEPAKQLLMREIKILEQSTDEIGQGRLMVCYCGFLFLGRFGRSRDDPSSPTSSSNVTPGMTPC